MTIVDKWAGALMTAKKAFDNAFLVEDSVANALQGGRIERRYLVPITTEAIVEIAKAIMEGDADGREDKTK